jgi:hypothetical protein
MLQEVKQKDSGCKRESVVNFEIGRQAGAAGGSCVTADFFVSLDPILNLAWLLRSLSYCTI